MGSGVSLIWVRNLDIFNSFLKHFEGIDFSVCHPRYIFGSMHWNFLQSWVLSYREPYKASLQHVCTSFYIEHTGHMQCQDNLPQQVNSFSEFLKPTSPTWKDSNCKVCMKLCCNEQWLLKHSQLSYSLIETTISPHILTYFEARYIFLHLSSWVSNH